MLKKGFKPRNRVNYNAFMDISKELVQTVHSLLVLGIDLDDSNDLDVPSGTYKYLKAYLASLYGKLKDLHQAYRTELDDEINYNGELSDRLNLYKNIIRSLRSLETKDQHIIASLRNRPSQPKNRNGFNENSQQEIKRARAMQMYQRQQRAKQQRQRMANLARLRRRRNSQMRRNRLRQLQVVKQRKAEKQQRKQQMHSSILNSIGNLNGSVKRPPKPNTNLNRNLNASAGASDTGVNKSYMSSLIRQASSHNDNSNVQSGPASEANTSAESESEAPNSSESQSVNSASEHNQYSVDTDSSAESARASSYDEKQSSSESSLDASTDAEVDSYTAHLNRLRTERNQQGNESEGD